PEDHRKSSNMGADIEDDAPRVEDLRQDVQAEWLEKPPFSHPSRHELVVRSARQTERLLGAAIRILDDEFSGAEHAMKASKLDPESVQQPPGVPPQGSRRWRCGSTKRVTI